jgi:hypothetical protein
VLKDAGVVTMPTVLGARRHAEKVAEWGVDAVIAQGEGRRAQLVRAHVAAAQVVDTVDIPVLGAGGFHDGGPAALAGARPASPWAPRFLLRSADSTVPDVISTLPGQEQRLDTVAKHGHRRVPAAGDPYRGGRRPREGHADDRPDEPNEDQKPSPRRY